MQEVQAASVGGYPNALPAILVNGVDAVVAQTVRISFFVSEFLYLEAVVAVSFQSEYTVPFASHPDVSLVVFHEAVNVFGERYGLGADIACRVQVAFQTSVFIEYPYDTFLGCHPEVVPAVR